MVLVGVDSTIPNLSLHLGAMVNWRLSGAGAAVFGASPKEGAQSQKKLDQESVPPGKPVNTKLNTDKLHFATLAINGAQYDIT